MTATIFDFHEHPTAHKRWADMERFALLKQLGAVPVFDSPVEMPCDVDPFDVAFFAPVDDPA